MNLRSISLMNATAVSHKLARQFSFPTPFRGLVEMLMFAGVFLAAGNISLGQSVNEMLGPMVPVVLLMMFCMVASGVYRDDITSSIMRLYAHSAYGFALATGVFLVTVSLVLPDYAHRKFIFFFLFFAFFVVNTVRPLISGTDFMDGGGRRTN